MWCLRVAPILIALCLSAPALADVIAGAWIQESVDGQPGQIFDGQSVVDPVSAYASASAFGGQSQASAEAVFGVLSVQASDDGTGARVNAVSVINSWFRVVGGPAEGFVEYPLQIFASLFWDSPSRFQVIEGRVQGCDFMASGGDFYFQYSCSQIAYVVEDGRNVVRIPYVLGVPFNILVDLYARAGGTREYVGNYRSGEAYATLYLHDPRVFDSAGNLIEGARINETELPEPSTALLTACGALLLLAARVRRVKRPRR